MIPVEALHQNIFTDRFFCGSFMLLRSSVAGRIYNLCAYHTSNSGFDRTFMPCSCYFYALLNNERGTKYRGLTYSAKQNCP